MNETRVFRLKIAMNLVFAILSQKLRGLETIYSFRDRDLKRWRLGTILKSRDQNCPDKQALQNMIQMAQKKPHKNVRFLKRVDSKKEPFSGACKQAITVLQHKTNQ